ncbi:acyltransferase [Dehalobacter sp.]|uniref:acyltransferase n=1 Tax=Dehalobacter sp. TaxID=1962289 RepID=UPI0025903DF0|nr:acyltransferase [Dehalobacter sp.]
MIVLRYIGKIYLLLSEVWHRFVWAPIQKAMLVSCGNKVYIGKYSEMTYHHVTIGNKVYIGAYASFMCANARIRIGNCVMFGPHVTIRTGDHRTDVIGRTMYDVSLKECLPHNNQDVEIEDDVWIGANVTILKGVKIGKGSVIGAGSLVVKDVPPYTVHVGLPSIKEWKRFDEETIKKHEQMIRVKS